MKKSLHFKPKILVVDDDPYIIAFLKKSLKPYEDVQFDYAQSYAQALSKIINENYDLYLMDYNLDEGFSSFDILKVLSEKENINNKVILMTAMREESILIEAYDLGVSNCLQKPLNIKILLAILNKNIRMLTDKRKHSIQVENVLLDTLTHNCQIFDRQKTIHINLTPIEYKILFRLMAAPGITIGKDELCQLGSDMNKPIPYKSLETHILNLRRKSHTFKKHISTQRGWGYTWSKP